MKTLTLLFILIIPAFGKAQDSIRFESSILLRLSVDYIVWKEDSVFYKSYMGGKSITKMATDTATYNRIQEVVEKHHECNAYAIKDQKGLMFLNCNGNTAKEAKEQFLWMKNNKHDWEYYHNQGYKCVHIFIGQEENVPK